MRKITTLVLALLGMVLLECVPADPSRESLESESVSQAAVVSGTIETGYEAVGALGYDGWFFQHFCTGTLIAPRWVLTAAHCLEQDGWPLRPRDVGFFVGTYSEDASSGTVYGCREFHIHDAYNPGDPARGTPPEHDIALVELSSAASETPIPYNDEPLIDADGDPVIWVGFGVSDPPHDGSGTKRSGSGHLDDVFWWYLVYGFGGQLPCSGDSGGPTLMEIGPGGALRVAGVISTADEGCDEGGTSTRVDGYSPWIEAIMAGRSYDPVCDLRGGDCADGFACLPNADGTGVCWLSEELGLGEACDPDWNTWDLAPCDDGLICAPVGFGQCLPMCFTDADCEDDSCEVPLYTNVENLGTCQPCQDIDGDGACSDVDCDDTDERAYPGASEDCTDRVDNDCDGNRDEDDSDCGCLDRDGDGTCEADDCDDRDDARSPAFDEVCDDEIDNDCDELIDEDDESCDTVEDDAGPDVDAGPDGGEESDGGTADFERGEDGGCECSSSGAMGIGRGGSVVLVRLLDLLSFAL